ncbi:aminotransferase class I/II-fold pyridoxal phosphate-dependent enzyme [Patescibacteria group bacterium]
MKLRDNKWGFDISKDNPFKIFRYLREIADKSVGEKEVVDLSRGDPGFGFSPSVRGREFFSYLVQLDTVFNNPDFHFALHEDSKFKFLWKKIEKYTRKTYTYKVADQLLEDFYFFLTRIEKYAMEQGLDWTKEKIVLEMFKYATISGGCYHIPKGEQLIRLVIANHYRKKFKLDINYEDLVLMHGVSHGIGIIFKILCDEKIGYLKKGDGVLLTSPSYAPYNSIIENRGLKAISMPMAPVDGSMVGDPKKFFSTVPENTKLICLIDPNNPTGFSFNTSFLKALANFAKERDILIVTDEVYADFFFSKKKSILNYAPERTIFIGGRSKIERSTGLRFGEYLITKEGQKYIGEKLLKKKFGNADNLMELILYAKAPGSIAGEFQHVTFVTGPSQYMGISHMIFGDDDRDEYLKRIRVNMEHFYEILGLPYNKNLYYACFNLKNIPDNKRLKLSAEELFVGLAKQGVVLIPANLFFSEEERKKKDFSYYARAALPNLTFSNLQKAARLMKKYLMKKIG